MIYTTTVTKKGQITIPKDFRDQLNLATGQRLALSLETTVKKGSLASLSLFPIPSLEMLRGSVKATRRYSKKKARQQYLSLVAQGLL